MIIVGYEEKKIKETIIFFKLEAGAGAKKLENGRLWQSCFF